MVFGMDWGIGVLIGFDSSNGSGSNVSPVDWHLVGFGESHCCTSPAGVSDHNCALVNSQLILHEWQPDGAETLLLKWNE